MTFLLCTMDAASPNPNPTGVVPAGSHSFLWDSIADGIGLGMLQSVILRATLDDAVSPILGTCSGALDIDNPTCLTFCGDCDGNGIGPSILDALVASQIAVGLATPTFSQTYCCDVDASGAIDVLDALGMALAASGLPAALMCP